MTTIQEMDCAFDYVCLVLIWTFLFLSASCNRSQNGVMVKKSQFNNIELNLDQQ